MEKSCWAGEAEQLFLKLFVLMQHGKCILRQCQGRDTRYKKNPTLHQARLKNRENYSMNRTATALPSTRTMRVSSSPPMSMGE